MRRMCLPLTAAGTGQEFEIHDIREIEGGQSHRLRELGLLEGRKVRVLSNRDPLICTVGECRFGLCRRLASCVLVRPVAAAG